MPHYLETTIGDTDLTVPYSLTGPDAVTNPSIVYIHGLACSEKDFSAASVTALLRVMPKLAFTEPGCDDTPYPEDLHIDMDHLVEVTRDLVTAAGLGEIILVGHSIGSIVATRYAAKYPNAVAGIISVEGNMRGGDCSMTRCIANGEETRESLIERFSASKNPGFHRYASRLSHTDPRALIDYARAAVEQSERDDLLDTFLDLSVPRLFICGSENVASMPHIGELEERGVDIAVIPESNHFPDADNPEVYFRVIREFVSSILEDRD